MRVRHEGRRVQSPCRRFVNIQYIQSNVRRYWARWDEISRNIFRLNLEDDTDYADEEIFIDRQLRRHRR